MNACKEKLLTVITESDIENHLLEDLDKLGAKGYTISCAKGKGERGVRNNQWSSNSNTKIEILCSTETCNKITDYLKKNYLTNYAMIIFVMNVDVFRHNQQQQTK